MSFFRIKTAVSGKCERDMDVLVNVWSLYTKNAVVSEIVSVFIPVIRE